MALSAFTVWEARTGGSDTACSGGFNPQNANMATDGAATSANTSSPVFTSASYTFVAGDVGAWLFIKSGSNWIPGWYQIASVSAGAATLTASVGTAVLFGGAVTTTNGADTYTPNTASGCATVASPTSATWSVDYSQQNAAQFAYTDLVSVTTTTITSVGFPFGKNCVGNVLKITSGTSWTVNSFEITQVTGTTATTDRSVGGAGLTGGNGYLGGAYAGPQLPCAFGGAGGYVWVKSGSYTMSSSSVNVANGKISIISSETLAGYNSLRGDNGTAPVFTASGISGLDMIAAGAANARVINIEVNGASLANIVGFNLTSNSSMCAYFCKASNCVTGFNDGRVYSCVADTCTTGFNTNTVVSHSRAYCVAKSCTTGFLATISGCNYVFCITISCTKGYNNPSGAYGRFINCIAYGGTDGFVIANSEADFIKCIAANNSTRGFDFSTGTGVMFSCAAYSNTTANVRYNESSKAGTLNFNFITCTADPFTNAASGDFSLNTTAGGGAALRGISVSFPSIISTTSYNDVGAAQHQDTGGGGGGVAGGSWGFC